MHLLNFTKAELIASNTNRDHPFRYFYLSTFGKEYPETRTVVKRDITSDLEITFFTDSRTPKVDQAQKNDKVSALFYHPAKQLQVRLYGKAQIITRNDTGYDWYLKQVMRNSDWKRDYAAVHIPGVPTKDEGTIIYGNTINLNVIKIHPEKMDIVLLGAQQHRRSKCDFSEGFWKEIEVVP